MAKMTIEFDSDDYEFFNRLALSTRMAAALWDWNQYLYNLKYTDHKEITREDLMNDWQEIINGINFEDIYT